MIDLHLHFDGSLLPRMVLELADEQGIELPPEQIFGLGPVIGAHIGPGAYGVVYIAKE